MSNQQISYPVFDSAGQIVFMVDANNGYQCITGISIVNHLQGNDLITVKTFGWAQPPLPAADRSLVAGKAYVSPVGEYDPDGATVTVLGTAGQKIKVVLVGTLAPCSSSSSSS